MYKIIVKKKGYIVAIYYNTDPVIGKETARMLHGDKVKIRVVSQGH